AASVADIPDFQIKMIAPEEWRIRKWLARAENVACGGLALALGQDPVLDAYPARARIRPARDVAGGKNSGNVSLHKFIDQNAVVGRDPCFFSKRSVWAYADPCNHQVTLQSRSVIELYISVLYDCRRSPEIKFYAVRLVSFANQVAEFASENLC